MSALPLLTLLLLAGASHLSSAAPNARIVDGIPINVGAFPYAVSVQWASDSTHFCGGCIINERYILTAAHCVNVGMGIQPYPAHYFQVRAGSIQRLIGGQLAYPKRIIIHSDYSKGQNDLALLELQQPLTLTPNVQPIELSKESPASGSIVIVSGWGAQHTDGKIPQRLQGGTQLAISSAECEERLYMAHEGLLCLVSTTESAKGMCAGDAGSPAVYNGKLVGIASFYVGACGTSNPDGYVSISHYVDWINANVD